MKNISFKILIRNYSVGITAIRDEILKKSNITINDWQNDQYTDEQYNTIISNLQQLIKNTVKNK